MAKDKIGYRELDDEVSLPISKVDTHVNDSDIHVTSEDKEAWNNGSNIPNATHDINGLMTSQDKTKLDNIEEKANFYTHPSVEYTPGVYNGFKLNNEGHIEEVMTDDSGAMTGTMENANKLGGVDSSKYALLDSPEFVGVPKAPTGVMFDSESQQIVNMEFAAAFLLDNAVIISEDVPEGSKNKLWYKSSESSLYIYNTNFSRWVGFTPKLVISAESAPMDNLGCIWHDTISGGYKIYDDTIFSWVDFTLDGSSYYYGDITPNSDTLWINSEGSMKFRDDEGVWRSLQSSFVVSNDTPNSANVLWINESEGTLSAYFRNNWKNIFSQVVESSTTEPIDHNLFWNPTGNELKLYIGSWVINTTKNIVYYTEADYINNGNKVVYPTDISATFVDIMNKKIYEYESIISDNTTSKITSTTQPNASDYSGYYWINTSTKIIYRSDGTTWTAVNGYYVTNTDPIEGEVYSYKIWYNTTNNKLYNISSIWSNMSNYSFSSTEPVNKNNVWIEYTEGESTFSYYDYIGSWSNLNSEIKISNTAGNMLKENTDGLYVGENPSLIIDEVLEPTASKIINLTEIYADLNDNFFPMSKTLLQSSEGIYTEDTSSYISITYDMPNKTVTITNNHTNDVTIKACIRII